MATAAAKPSWPALALMCGTAVNQDGRSSSLTSPNGPSQQVTPAKGPCSHQAQHHESPWCLRKCRQARQVLSGRVPQRSIVAAPPWGAEARLGAGAGGECAGHERLGAKQRGRSGRAWYWDAVGRPNRGVGPGWRTGNREGASSACDGVREGARALPSAAQQIRLLGAPGGRSPMCKCRQRCTCRMQTQERSCRRRVSGTRRALPG